MKNINVIIFCKLFDQDAYYTIYPLAALKVINRVFVFRDRAGIPIQKVTYYQPSLQKPVFIKNILKFLKVFFIPKKTELIFVGVYELPHGLLAYLASRFYRKPFILSIISNPGYEKLRKGLRKWLMFFLITRADVVTVTGSKSKEFLITNHIPSDKIIIMPNSIDVEKFRPINRIRKYDIISIGRISAEKNIPILIEIVNRIKKEIPSVAVAIAGSGPETEYIQKLINKLQLNKNIELTGYINDDKIVEFFNSGKLFVLNSETEGFPRTVIQAIACGIPVITSSVGDLEDLIENDRNGYIIDHFNNISEFSNKILFLLNNEGVRKEFSDSAIKKVRNEFSFAAASNIWSKIIQELNS